MSAPHGENVPPPSPELLAAYVDGEFEGNEALLSRQRSIADWLEQHPEAAADILAWRRLKCLCQDTTPEEPSEEAWGQVWSRVEHALAQPAPAETPRPRAGGWSRGIGAAAILLACSVSAWVVWQQLGGGALPTQATGGFRGDTGGLAAVQNVEPFPVAGEDEVIVLHVEGADTHTLAVGRLPVNGPLMLAVEGDILLNSIEPAASDDMVPDVKLGQGAPMIWARVDRELRDP